MKFAVYSRKSKYTGKGESIENQIEMCRDYIINHFKNVQEDGIVIFEDEGFSGKTIDRPQFQKMLVGARSGIFDYIVCYRLDRISRSVSDFSTLIEELNDHKISFICIKEQFDTSTPMGRAMMYIASVFAQLERETIAERVRDNMLMLARTGRWLGGTTPTGFVSEKNKEVIIDGKVKSSCKLKWNPSEIDTVKLIYEKYLELQSVSGVSKYLIEKQIKSRNGKFFSLLGIKDILSNPVYCIADEEARNYFISKESDVCFDQSECSNQYGLLSYNKRDYTRKQSPRLDESEWIIAIGKHRGIIRGADWVMIQKKLAENKIANKKAIKPHNDYSLLSGLIICKKCNSRMFAKQRHNRANSFDYICSSKLKGGKKLCASQNLNGQETDDLVCDYLLDYMNENSGIRQLFDRLKKKIQEEDKQDPLKLIDLKITQLEEEINGYIVACSKPNLSDSFIQNISAKVSDLDSRLKELKEQKAALVNNQENVMDDELQLDVISRSLSYFKENFQNLTVPERRELIRLLVDKIEWDGEELNIFIYGE